MLKKAQIIESLQNDIHSLEVKRKAIANTYYLYYPLYVISVIIMLIGFYYGIAFLIIGLLFVGFCIYKTYGLSKAKADFQTAYKLDILKKALQAYSPDLEFSPDYGIGEQEFNNSYLFDKLPDRYYSEDFMKAKVEKTAFYFSEVHAEYKTETHTKNGKQTHWHDLFKGLLFVADFNKNFLGTTIVRPKDFGFNFSQWTGLKFFQKSSQSIVELENVAFMKEFVCYSHDQVEARYILTPKLMEEILALNAKCNTTISLSFVNSSLYIAFPLRNNYFDASVFQNLVKAQNLENDLEVIDFVFQIIEDLDLNTRIWTKA